MPIGTDGDGTDDNEGPHCRNCHTGANDCFTCHTNDDRFISTAYGDANRVDVSSAFTANTSAKVGNQTNYSPISAYRQSATVGAVGDPCLDGGFSFPHRTLGVNMLKDELFGVDFDGTPIAAGEVRTANANTLAATAGVDFQAGDAAQAFVTTTGSTTSRRAMRTSIIPAVQSDNPAIVGQAAENYDSVCIDCHGDATYWNGDDPSLYTFKPARPGRSTATTATVTPSDGNSSSRVCRKGSILAVPC
jgi:hypothetical protein